MDDTQITVVGRLATDPVTDITPTGVRHASFRVACTPRRFDRESGEWRDGTASFYTVRCWRRLAENVLTSGLARGRPVLVTGRLTLRTFARRDGTTGHSADIDATSLGFDLRRCTATYHPRPSAAPVVEGHAAEAA